MIDRFVYFLFVVTNVMLCVLITIDMYMGKKALTGINKELTEVHIVVDKLTNDLAGLDKHVNNVHYNIKDFSNFPPQFSGEKN
mgnify:CR=1 FL=1